MLNIVFNESRVFSTKQRAPFYICLEIFRPEEEKEPINPFRKTFMECCKSDIRLSDARTLKTEMSKLSQDHQMQKSPELREPAESMTSSFALQPKIRVTLDKLRQNHRPPEDKLEEIREASQNPSEIDRNSVQVT